MDDCARIFGYYLHHFPYLGMRGEADAKMADEQFAATRARFLEMTGTDLVIEANSCGGGGHGCGGHSCGSHSCGGHSDGGHGGHSDGGSGHHTPDSTPYIATCSGGDSDWKKKEKKEERSVKIPPPANQPSLWRRILGLSPELQTENEVGTETKILAAGRPGRAEILKLLADTGTDGTRH